MDNERSFLALFLDAPLQSWGYQSKFDRRTTLSYPTRSGIIGMICAAMGIDRTDTSGLTSFADMHMTVYTFSPGTRLTDFHTVGGGWDKKKNPQNVVPKASGSPGKTVVSRREYLEGGKFGVTLNDSINLLTDIERGLQNPRWGVWLGRKSCIPASPIHQGIFSRREEAVTHLANLAGTRPTRVVEEVKEFAEGTDTLMDQPISFVERSFAPRRVLVDHPNHDPDAEPHQSVAD